MRLLMIALLGVALAAAPAHSDGLKLRKSGKSRLAQFERMTRMMDSRLAGQYQQSARLKDTRPKPKAKPKGPSCKTVTTTGWREIDGVRKEERSEVKTCTK